VGAGLLAKRPVQATKSPQTITRLRAFLQLG
jgi:hypothetical protein